MMQLKAQVKYILAEKPESRNSDITLMIELWKRFYPKHIKKSTETGKQGI
jgi:hypothetical protein